MTIPRNTPMPIIEKANGIAAALQAGTALADLKAKRMKHDRNVISVPVGYRHRLVCRAESRGIVPCQLMTHEAYNALARNNN